MKMTEIGRVVAIPDGSITEISTNGDTIEVIIEEYTSDTCIFTFFECYLIEYHMYTGPLSYVKVIREDERLTHVLKWNFGENLSDFPETDEFYIIKFFGINSDDDPELSIIANKVEMLRQPYTRRT